MIVDFQYIRAQFLPLQPFEGPSGISVLLDGVTEEHLEKANAEVDRKTIEDLLKPYGPNEVIKRLKTLC